MLFNSPKDSQIAFLCQIGEFAPPVCTWPFRARKRYKNRLYTAAAVQRATTNRITENNYVHSKHYDKNERS